MRFLTPAVLALSLMACSDDASDDIIDTETGDGVVTDGNDSIADAVIIDQAALEAIFVAQDGSSLLDANGVPMTWAPVQPQGAAISPAGDRDFYGIEMKGGNGYVFLINSSAFDPLVRVYENDQVAAADALVIAEGFGGVSGNLPMFLFVPPADGIYYIEVMQEEDYNQENGLGGFPTGGFNYTYDLYFGVLETEVETSDGIEIDLTTELTGDTSVDTSSTDTSTEDTGEVVEPPTSVIAGNDSLDELLPWYMAGGNTLGNQKTQLLSYMPMEFGRIDAEGDVDYFNAQWDWAYEQVATNGEPIGCAGYYDNAQVMPVYGASAMIPKVTYVNAEGEVLSSGDKWLESEYTDRTQVTPFLFNNSQGFGREGEQNVFVRIEDANFVEDGDTTPRTGGAGYYAIFHDFTYYGPTEYCQDESSEAHDSLETAQELELQDVIRDSTQPYYYAANVDGIVTESADVYALPEIPDASGKTLRVYFGHGFKNGSHLDPKISVTDADGNVLATLSSDESTEGPAVEYPIYAADPYLELPLADATQPIYVTVDADELDESTPMANGYRLWVEAADASYFQQ